MYANYQDVIQQNLVINEKEWYFKSNPHYNQILEHVSIQLGYDYLTEIQKRYSTLFNENKDKIISICLNNDKYGKPFTHTFDNFCQCSPSNLRYVLHAFIILEYMTKLCLKSVDIIEIGGGYGGLSLFIHNIAHLFDISINSYSIFDLPEPLLLQQQYLKLFDIHINICNIKDDFNLNFNSFLISNYAFSEISNELQNLYTEKVINIYTLYGFLTWNFISIYEFVKDKIITKELEFPLSCQNNYYVYYKPK